MRGLIFNSPNSLFNSGGFRRRCRRRRPRRRRRRRRFFFFIHLPQAFPVIFIFSLTPPPRWLDFRRDLGSASCPQTCPSFSSDCCPPSSPFPPAPPQHPAEKPQTLKSPGHPLKAAISLNVAAIAVPAGVVNFAGSEKKRRTPTGAKRNGLRTGSGVEGGEEDGEEEGVARQCTPCRDYLDVGFARGASRDVNRRKFIQSDAPASLKNFETSFRVRSPPPDLPLSSSGRNRFERNDVGCILPCIISVPRVV